MPTKSPAKRKSNSTRTRRDAVAGRVPYKIAEAIDAWAKKNKITRSVAVSQLLEAGLRKVSRARWKRDSENGETGKLSGKDRRG